MASLPQSEQLARTPEPFLPNRNHHQFISPDREVRESQGEREPHLAEREREREDQSSSVERNWNCFVCLNDFDHL